ncbi:MAG: Uma2 family endonuclease [Spirochaetaceae bacterium]|nr:Uma2 family endonuclease [Spirochaetaceae bacterium]
MSLAYKEPSPKVTHYTYADYLEWDEDFRAEIIGGRVFMMAPPLTVHQRVCGVLFNKIYNYLEGKPCEAFIAPFGVRLYPEEDHSDDTVVEPDIVVVCDSSKVDERGYNGAPDLVIEVLSPSTAQKDRLFKFRHYLKAGVREYWIVDPDTASVQVHVLDQGRFMTDAYGIIDPEDELAKYTSDRAPVSVLPGLEIDLKTVFPPM